MALFWVNSVKNDKIAQLIHSSDWRVPRTETKNHLRPLTEYVGHIAIARDQK